MKREVILKATGNDYFANGANNASLDPNSNPYPWLGGTPSKALYTVWNNWPESGPAGAVGYTDSGDYAYLWPGGVDSTRTCCTGDFAGQCKTSYATVTFEKGPTLAEFTKVTIYSAFDYQQSGPNNWYFEGDNSHGPGCWIIMRNRAKNAYLYGGGGTYGTDSGLGPGLTPGHNLMWSIDEDPSGEFYEGEDHNTRPSDQGFHLYELKWEMLSHPEGGPFTLQDINDLAVGVEWRASPGLHADPASTKCYIQTQGSFFKIRTPYVRVVLEVEDLGGFVSNMRHASSLALRLFRRSRNVITPKTYLHRAPSGLGELVNLSHPRGPDVAGKGWGQRRLERRTGLVLARTYEPEGFKVQDETFDMHAYQCLGWGAYRIDAPWNPELQGLSLIEKGRSFTHDRTGDAWSPRPGDGRLMRVLEDYPNISFHGLAVQDGGDTAVCPYNWDTHQTGWATVANTGTFTATSDDDVSMVEEQGYLTSDKLEYGAGGGTGGREKSLGALGSGRLHVRMIVKNTVLNTPNTEFAEWYLKNDSGDYWDETNREWTTNTACYNQIVSMNNDGEVIAFSEAIADSIPCAADTYSVGVGHFSSSIGPVTLHTAIVDVQHSDTTVAGARTPQVLLANTILRTADSHKMEHVWGRELWTPDRGLCVAEFSHSGALRIYRRTRSNQSSTRSTQPTLGMRFSSFPRPDLRI
jgi:hypothetical protein